MGEEYMEDIEEEMEEEMEAPNNDTMVSWEDHVGVKEGLVTVPKCGGLFKQDDDKVMADKSHLNPSWNHKKVPVWAGQFRPSSIKQIQKTEQ
eukprot:9634032-Ditylum_brightwellii.AAC.1